MLGKFLKYYKPFDSRPVFESVEEMLKWAGLYDLTTQTLEEELVDAGLSPLLIQELVTVRKFPILPFSLCFCGSFNPLIFQVLMHVDCNVRIVKMKPKPSGLVNAIHYGKIHF